MGTTAGYTGCKQEFWGIERGLKRMEARFSILCERFSLAAINDFSPGMLLGLILKEGVRVVAGTKILNIYQYPD